MAQEGYQITEAFGKKLAAMVRENERKPKNRLTPQRRWPIPQSSSQPLRAVITDLDTSTGKCSWKEIVAPTSSPNTYNWTLSSSSVGLKTGSNFAIDIGQSTCIIIGDIVILSTVNGQSYYSFVYQPDMMQCVTTQVIPSGGGGTATVGNSQSITIFNGVAAQAVPSGLTVFIQFNRTVSTLSALGNGNLFAAGKWYITAAPC